MTKLMTKAEIQVWAKANYEKSYFAQTIIECWDDSDFEGIDKSFLLDLQNATDEQERAATCDMY